MPRNGKPARGDENSVLMYHRNNLFGNRALVQPDGSLTTFRGAIVEAPGGKQALIPTYWNGAERSIPDAVRLAIKSGIDFPMYNTVEEAEAAEQRLHKVMENDVAVYNRRKQNTPEKY